MNCRPVYTSISNAAAAVNRSPSAVMQAIRRGRISAHVRFDGDKRAVDLDEVVEYFATAKRGRPRKTRDSG
jgi:hypothetical protein